MEFYYDCTGTLVETYKYAPAAALLRKNTSEHEHSLQKEWASKYWDTTLAVVLEEWIGEHYTKDSLELALTRYLPYQDGGLISIIDRMRNYRRTLYRPAKAAKILFPGRDELFYKSFAEGIIKPTATSLELTMDFRSAYLAVKSCMSKTETTLRAVELYKAIPGLTCLIIKSEKGAIVGRAICNPIKKVYLELYLHPLLDDGDVSHLLEGWSWDSNFLIGERLPLVRTPNGILCPYLDTDSGMVRIMEDHLLITSDYGSGFATTIHGLIVG